MSGLDLPPASPRVSVSAVIEAASAYYEIPRADLLGSGGDVRSVRRRHVARFVAARLTTMDHPRIARQFGTHAVNIHRSVRQVEKLAAGDEQLAVDARIIATLVTEVVARGRVAENLKHDSDPLVRALDIVAMGSARARISTDDIDAIARCLIGYARASGDLAVEGEPAEDDDPTPEPADLALLGQTRKLLTLVQAVGKAHAEVNNATYSRGQKSAETKRDGALTRLLEHARLMLAPVKD